MKFIASKRNSIVWITLFFFRPSGKRNSFRERAAVRGSLTAGNEDRLQRTGGLLFLAAIPNLRQMEFRRRLGRISFLNAYHFLKKRPFPLLPLVAAA